jgi:hypothetical protein
MANHVLPYKLRVHLDRWAFTYAAAALIFVIVMMLLFYRP